MFLCSSINRRRKSREVDCDAKKKKRDGVEKIEKVRVTGWVNCLTLFCSTLYNLWTQNLLFKLVSCPKDG